MTNRNRSNPPAFTQALESVTPALDAIPEDQLEPVRHDITVAFLTVLGVCKHASEYRGEVRTQIGEDAAKHFDVLEAAARACYHAHAQHLPTVHGITTGPLVDELGQMRRVLLAEARVLVTRGKLSPDALAEIVGGTSQSALCLDILQLVSVFRANWPSLSSITAVTKDELDQAESLASALATTLGENAQGTSPVAPTADQRARTYTYFVRTYDEVRRAIHFIRWSQGDADEIVPSLSAGRTRSAVADPTPVHTGPVVPIVPVATTTTTSTPAPTSTSNGAATPAAPGTPSAQPFATSS